MKLKRIIALLLSLVMTFSLIHIPAYAAEIDGFMSDVILEEGTVGGKSGIYVNWKLTTGSEGIYTANIALAYDKTVFDLVDGSGAVLALSTEDPPILNNAQLIKSDFDFFNDLYAKDNGDTLAIVAFVRSAFVSTKVYSSATTVGQFFLAYKEGKSVADVTNSTIRYATPAEAELIAQSSVVGMGTGDLTEFKYGTTNSTDTAGWENNLTFVYPSPTGGSEQQPTTSDYEIWYELDSTATDTLTPNFKDYQYDTTEGATNQVKAEIFLKSTKADVTVQAYDIYLSHNTKLTYSGENTMAGAVYKTVDVENKIAAAKGDQVSHIQLVKDSGKTINLTAGEAESLGAITFDIASSAIYGEDLEITLKVAADTENTTKTADVTNISLATTADGGQVASFYPMNTGTDLGAEVVTTYTVTYDADNGTQATIQTVGRNQTATQPANPEKAGYEFLGWYVGNEAFDFATLITQNVQLTAKWTEAMAEYTVKHMQEKLDGTYEVKETEKPSGQTGTSTKADANTYEGFTAQAITQQTIAADGSTVVEIYYTRNSYNLTWNLDNGTETDTTEVKYGTTITAPADPQKIGYEFGGWDQAITTMPAKDMTITAKWTPITYSIVFNENGGTGMTTGIQDAEYDTDVTLTQNGFTKTGYTFNGWNTKADGSGEKYENTAKNLTSTPGATVTLYAQWKANTYTVRFNPGTGVTAEPYSQDFTYGADEVALRPNEFTHPDSTYAFAGWAETPGGTVKYNDGAGVKNLTDENNGTVDLYAVWKQNEFKINYSSSPADIGMKTDGLEGTFSSSDGYVITNEPTATGYTFTKWTTETQGVTISSDGKTVTIPVGQTGEVNLVAEFTPKQYTITFDTAGGSAIDAITKDYGASINKPNDPTKKGYTFDGWSEGIPATMPAENKTITAKWKINQYTITFDGGDGAENMPENITQDYNTTVTAPTETPTKTGYTFAGWDVDGDGTYDETNDKFYETMPHTDAEDKTITVNAVWTEHTYDLSYDDSDTNVNYGDVQGMEDVKYSETVTLPTANEVTKTGYILSGWTTVPNPDSDDTVYNPGATVSGLTAENNDAVTLYPVWTAITYTIEFNANGGEGEMTGTTGVKFDQDVVLPVNTFTKTGYTFSGWTKTSGATAKDYEDKATVKNLTATNEDTVTLYAVWTATPYTITFDLNGGTAYTGDTNITDNKLSYTIESNTKLPGATRSLYTFAGWKVTIADGNWVKDIVHGPATTNLNKNYGNVTLTAQWNFMDHEIEEYKYALNTGLKLLRVADNLNTGDTFSAAYKFNNVPMYYTTDENYLIAEGDKGVFYTLIDANTYVGENGKLNAAGEAMLTSDAATAPVTIDYTDRDINNDDVVNIADANVVYQMTLYGGGYYSGLEIEQRLRADMDTTKTTGTNEYRGSIADVNKIVNQINGVVETTNP